MGIPVVTVAAGGMPVVEGVGGLPVEESSSGYGVAVTKVAAYGMPVTFTGGIEVSIPAGLGWTPTWKIYKNGSTYTVNIDFNALKPAPAVIYYCSPTGSPTNSPTHDNPADPITPRRFVTLANTNGGICEARIAGGVYYGNIGFDGNNFTCAGVVLSLWSGQQAAGRPVFVKRSTNLIAPWTLDSGSTYYTAHTVANTPVFDLLYRNAGGVIPRLTAAANLAACQATPGSCFFDSGASRMYVRAQDSRNLVGDANMLVPTAGTVFNYAPTIDGQLWADGIDFVGSVLGTQATATKTLAWNARDVGYFAGANALALLGPVTSINLAPRVNGANSDGMNYHGNAAGDVKALEYDLRSGRNGYDAAGTNNTSTLHELCKAISVEGDYAGSQDRCVHDIQTSKRFMVGATIRASAGAGATAITVQAGQGGLATTEIWLDDCVVENSTTAGLFADTGCAIRHRNMSIAGLTTGGGGTIGAFT